MITPPKENEIEFEGNYYNQTVSIFFKRDERKGEKKKEVEVKNDFRFFVVFRKISSDQ
jgi:hypothetical protein